jgi:hypothetical protein
MKIQIYDTGTVYYIDVDEIYVPIFEGENE